MKVIEKVNVVNYHYVACIRALRTFTRCDMTQLILKRKI